MGVVYQCRDEQLMRDVAIKMLLPELMADKSNVEIFRQEARLAAQLEHPNIVTVYEFGVEERQKKQHHYVAMEYLPGGNLANRVISGPLAVEHCLNWMKQLASGLSFAHKRGVVHQDIKADNIFITTEGDLKIGDFGLARLLVGRVHYNSSTKGMGTPAYMSPELCRGEPQDHRSDIYSLGVLFFEMATGQLPFRARGMIEMATKHSSAPIPSARRMNPLIPDVLDKVIKRMMGKTPEERYQSMAEVLTILDDLIFELRVARLGIGTRPLLRSGPVVSDQISVGHQPLTKTEALPAAPRADSLPLLPSEGATVDGTFNLVSGHDPANSKARSEELIADLEKELAEAPAPTDDGRQSAPATVSDAAIRISASDAIALQGSAEKVAAKSRQEVKASAIAKATANKLQSISLPRKAKPSLDVEWVFRTKGPIGWSSAPIMDKDDRTLFFACADGAAYAVDANTGEELWRYQTDAPLMASPVIVADNIAAVNSAGRAVGLTAKSGKLLWSHQIEDQCLATPAVYKDVLFIPGASGSIFAVDTDSGSRQWVYKAHKPIVCAPYRHAELVLFGTRGGDFHAISAANGEPVWKFAADGPVVAGAAASVDTVYFGTQNGTFYALEAQNGGLVWEYPADYPIIGKAVIAFTSVVFCSHNKWIYCCEKYDGTLKWKASVRGKVFANLVATRDLIIAVTHEGWLQAFDSGSGELRWQKDLGQCLESAPLLSTNRIFIGSVDGELKAYSLTEALTAKA